MNSTRSKHIDVRHHHFVRNLVAEGEIKIAHVISSEQHADTMTKALGYEDFAHHRAVLTNVLLVFAEIFERDSERAACVYKYVAQRFQGDELQRCSQATVVTTCRQNLRERFRDEPVDMCLLLILVLR